MSGLFFSLRVALALFALTACAPAADIPSASPLQSPTTPVVSHSEAQSQPSSSSTGWPLSVKKIDGLLVSKAGASVVVWRDRLFVMGGSSSVPIFDAWTLGAAEFNANPLVYNGAFYNAGELPPSLSGGGKYPQSNPVVIQNRLYKGVNAGTGGLIRRSFIYELQRESTDGSSWSSTEVLQLPLAGQTALVGLDNTIYALGGWEDPQVQPDGKRIEGTFTDILAIEPMARTVKTIGKMPDNRRCMWTAAVAGKLYAIGGGTEVLEIDPDTGQTQVVGHLPTARSFGDYTSCEGATAAVIQGQIYIAGGTHYDSQTQKTSHYSDILAIDPQSGEVKKVGELPSARYGVTLSYFKQKLYALGGHDGKSTLLDVLEINGAGF